MLQHIQHVHCKLQDVKDTTCLPFFILLFISNWNWKPKKREKKERKRKKKKKEKEKKQTFWLSTLAPFSIKYFVISVLPNKQARWSGDYWTIIYSDEQ